MKKLYLFLFLLSFDAHAINVVHNFDVSIGSFDACHTNFEYGINKTEYKIQSKVQTKGMFNKLYPFKAQYSTLGRVEHDKLETSSYKYTSKSRFNLRTKELIYDNNGNPVYRISSKNGKEKRNEIEKNIKNSDTTDLQSVFAELAKQYNNLKFCRAKMEVFDGKRRFDVIFEDEGKTELQTPFFEGPATKCSMYIDNLGAKGDDLLWDISSDKPIYFWLMEDKETKAPFIAKIEIKDTILGRLQVITSKIEVTK